MIRYCLDMFVIFGCGYIGFMLASGLDTRIRQLEGLEQMLGQLAFNVGFLSLPIGEAVSRTADSQEGAVKLLLNHVTELMQRYPHITMREAWEEAVRYSQKELCLEQDDLMTMDDFAKYVGQGDKDSALNAMQMASVKLKISIEQAREKQKKDGKLCKGLGFLSGIFIVLVLA